MKNLRIYILFVFGILSTENCVYAYATEHLQQSNVQFVGILKAGYELSYNYANNPFQISTLGDENYRTDNDVANNLIEKQHAYEYDANGNLIYVNTAREKKDGTQAEKSQERKLLWDEENRLEAIDENGFVSNYWYDAAGERTVKTSGESEQMFVNGIFSGGNTGTANFTAYVNPYIVVSKGGHYTKHIYIGSQRIVSKLGDLDSYGADPRRIEYAGNNVDGALVNYKTKYEASQQTIKDRYAIFEVPYLGKDNDDYVNGQGFCCDDTPQGAGTKAVMQNDNPELFQYYYHSDHLGSTSLITNLDGEVVQHVEYVPFGEVFIEERNNTWNTPYLFNAKELDEETGLYYYGARYYEARTSVWLSTDPLQEDNPNVSTYVYCNNNPIMNIDPNGMASLDLTTDYVNDKGELLFRTNDLLTDVIIVPDANIPVLEDKLQTAQDNGTINDPETNKNKLHTLGQTPEQYTNQKTNGMGADWAAGYVSTYEPTYNGEKINFWNELIHFIAGASDEARQIEGGRGAGKMNGEQDRKDGKINRLNPKSSMKNNSPLLQLETEQEIILHIPPTYHQKRKNK